MNRALAIAGWGYVALCGAILATRPGSARSGEPPSPAAAFTGDGGAWFSPDQAVL